MRAYGNGKHIAKAICVWMVYDFVYSSLKSQSCL